MVALGFYHDGQVVCRFIVNLLEARKKVEQDAVPLLRAYAKIVGLSVIAVYHALPEPHLVMLVVVPRRLIEEALHSICKRT